MLKGKIIEDSQRTLWAEFKPGFQVQIRHITRSKMNKIREAAERPDWDVRGADKSSIDPKKLLLLLGREMIVGWRGLTPDVLRLIVDMDSYPESEVPYSPDDAAELLERVYDFDRWAQTLSSDFAVFDAARRLTEKKSEPEAARQA